MTEPDHIARLRAFRQYKDSFATDELKDALALLDDYDALAARLADEKGAADAYAMRLAEAEALLKEARACLYMVQDDQIAADIDAFLSPDSATHRENDSHD